ncbi:tumor necrosis factor receptor superfamily member 9a isoform X2 [Channa argus]|uniref:tumor necrosis factor receptor superfamily member 9a isoform X2 n=1 Tax=Channa argus TaxID=215402 RepID=UPI003520B663
MSVTLFATVLYLLMRCSLGSIGQIDTGCMRWTISDGEACCEACYPGNRLVKQKGPNPQKLCTPCENGTYTVKDMSPVCDRCTQCVGALKQLEACTATKDTKCGCIEGLTCGDNQCSHCVKTCGKGEEPTDNRSCSPCPEGSFNDQIHKKCKKHSAKCPNPDEYIVTEGTAFSDIMCTAISVEPTHKKPSEPLKRWSLFLTIIIIVTLVGLVIIIMTTIVAVKTLQTKKKTKKTPKVLKTPIIRTPTDDPRTLIAIECSFHEAQQEQGSSTESLDSKDSTIRLIA